MANFDRQLTEQEARDRYWQEGPDGEPWPNRWKGTREELNEAMRAFVASKEVK